MAKERKELVSEYIKSEKAANNEAAKKEIFVSFLTNLFGGVDKFGIIQQFASGAERRITNIARAGRASGEGRADTQYGNVIIEFEHDLNRTGAHAEDQLKEYLAGNWNSGAQNLFTLIATDCLRWRVYTLDYDSLFALDSLDADQLRLKIVEELVVDSDAADEFYLFLDRHLFGRKPVKATLYEILRRFGNGSALFQAVMLNMRDAFREVKDSPEIQVAYAQWQRFLSIAYGRFEASEQIFLIHSYLSGLAKILAYQVISGEKYLDDDIMYAVLNGDAFKRLNVANFTENDFYRWTAKKNRKLTAAFRMVADELSLLDFTEIDEDILKGIYQELVDDDTRHGLGEYYTPDWLCAKIVESENPDPNHKILDPACGSGSFLKAVANHFIRQNPGVSARELNASLYGIDVHPLSVQITKATLLIAYGARLAAEPQPITLNIFLANTLLLPKEDITLLGGTYAITVDERRLHIPAAIFADKELFGSLVATAEFLAESAFGEGREREKSQIQTIFKNRLRIANEDKATLNAALILYQTLLAAKKANRDSIWAYILANTYTPFFLKNQFDLIIGNPPWLVFRDIVDNDYQNEMRELARRSGALPRAETLFTYLELASVFAGHCLNYFLKPGGKLAFVMPRSIFVADQHHRMREGKIKFLKILELWDLAKVDPLFNVPACVLFCERGNQREATSKEIEGKTLSGKLAQRDASRENIAKKLKSANTVFYLSSLNQRTAWSETRVNLAGTSHYIDKFRQGATLVPRSLCFVDIDQPVSGDLENRLLRVKSAEAIYREAKEPWKSVRISGSIHSKFLFETVLANNIVPFGLNGTFMVSLPLLCGSQSQPKLLSATKLEEIGELESAKWFRNASEQWEEYRTERNQNTSFEQYLNWQNKLVLQNLNTRHVVIYTMSGTNTVSTFIDRNEIYLPFVVDYVTYYHSTNDLNEARYLCAFLRSRLH